MFKKLLLKSVATTTVLTSGLAVSLVAGPAMTTASPEVRTVACEYPADVSTTTQLSLERSVAIYGVSTSATARVSRDEAGSQAPTGRMRFVLKNSDGSVRNTWTVTLSGGEASIRLPRRLPSKRTYSVRARYLPKRCSIFKHSLSAPAYYTVHKAGTRTVVRVPNVHRGEWTRVHVVVRSGSPLSPHGRVKIVVERRARVLASQVHRLRSSRVNATFRRFRPGYYNVKVRYFGGRNFRGSRGSDDFRVFRR